MGTTLERRHVRTALIATGVVGFATLFYLVFAGVIGGSTTSWTVRFLDSRTQQPLEGVRVSGRVYDGRWHLNLGAGDHTLFEWQRLTDRDGNITVLMPDYGYAIAQATALSRYQVVPTVEDEKVLRDQKRHGKVRYLTPAVDADYQVVRYNYYMARTALADRDRSGDPAWVLSYRYRDARARAHTDRERSVLLAFCRHADVVRAASAAGFPSVGDEAYQSALRSMLETCSPYVHSIDAATPRNAISGYLADADGIDPIAGAVVSLTWRLSPNAAGKPGEGTSPHVQTWQTRSGQDGYFEIEAPDVDAVELGSSSLSDVRPEVRVYALGRDVTDLKLSALVAKTDGLHVFVPAERNADEVFRLSPPRVDSAQLDAQISAWYTDLRGAIEEERRLGGKEQVPLSYRPLMDLLAEACAVIEQEANTRPRHCDFARAEFGIELPSRVLAALYLPPPIVSSVTPVPAPAVLMGGPDKPGVAGLTQAPPRD